MVLIDLINLEQREREVLCGADILRNTRTSSKHRLQNLTSVLLNLSCGRGMRSMSLSVQHWSKGAVTMVNWFQV